MFDHLITKHNRKAQKWDTIEFFFSPIQTLHIDPETVINSKIERYSPIAQIVNEIPFENYVTMVNTIHEFGQYI